MSRNLGYFTFRKVQNDDYYTTGNVYNLVFRGQSVLFNKLKKSDNFILTRDKKYQTLLVLRGYTRSRLQYSRLGQQPKYKANGNRIPKKFNVNKEVDITTLTVLNLPASV